MLKKFDWNAPITWKGYLKFSVIATAIGMIFSGIYWVVLFHDTLEEWWNDHKPEFLNR